MFDIGGNQRVLVTGANGFVGRHLVAELLKRKIPVTAATRQSCMLAGLQTVPVANIDAKTNWRPALAGCSFVVHLAGRAHVLKDSAGTSDTAFQTVNELGTGSLADQAAEMGVKQLLFLSTIAVYDPVLTNLTAETNVSPQTNYAKSKLAAEQYLHSTSARMSHTIFRAPLVYGPGVGARFLQLLKLVYNRVPMPLGTIQNRRNMICVSNLVDAIIHALGHEAAVNRTFLVADVETVSTASIFRQLADAMNRAALIWSLPKPLLNAAVRAAGLSGQWRKLTGTLTLATDEIEQQLSWSPPVSVAEGLKTTGHWYVHSRNQQ